MSKTISRTVCSKCGKKNYCVWEGGEGCKTPECNNRENMQTQKQSQEFVSAATLDFKPIVESYRGISKATCDKLGIELARVGTTEFVRYTHINLDKTTAYKTRFPNKVFSWENKKEEVLWFGLDKCGDYTRPIIITEGNEDTASLHDLGFQACSVHSAGDVGLTKSNIDEVNKYSEVWFCIENDQAGISTKQKLKEAFKHKLLREVDLQPRKDANDWIQTEVAEDRLELQDRLTKAIELVPEGIIFGNQIDWQELYKPLPKGIMLPYPKINSLVKGGILPGDLWLLGAGVSVGKSSLLRELSVYFRKQGFKVGNIFIEEDQKVSQLNYIATELGYPIGEVVMNPTIIPEDKFRETYERLLNTSDLMFPTDDFVPTTDNLLKTIEYLANIKKYDIIVVDHLTAIINSSGVSRGGKVHDIDYLMEQLFRVCRKTKIRLLLVSHLKRKDGDDSWNTGARPQMSDLRGSGSLEGKPDVILMLSRNMKAESGRIDILQTEVVKNRWFSKLGYGDDLIYITETGRLEL